MFDVFFYRSSLWHHSLRVFLITQELSKFATKSIPKFDSEKAQILALVHDDAEMITGDVQLGHKEQMNTDQLKEIEDAEVRAIEKLGDIYPKKTGSYVYKKLLYNALRKDCVEAQLVSYADKLDAFGESFHDLLGGNISALRAVMNYTIIVKEMKNKYPALGSLHSHKVSPLLDTRLHTDPWGVHKESYLHLNKPHTRKSIEKKTEFSFYNKWRELVVRGLGEEGIRILTTKVESL